MQDPKNILQIKKKYRKIIYVDIDSTICECLDETYTNCSPYPNRIKKINKLYDDNCYILYWTARGSCTGKDWTELTINQLNSWGCKYNKLVVKKPYYDLFIDDKNINSEEYFKDC